MNVKNSPDWAGILVAKRRDIGESRRVVVVWIDRKLLSKNKYLKVIEKEGFDACIALELSFKSFCLKEVCWGKETI